MSEPSRPEIPPSGDATSSLEGSPARTSATPGDAGALMANDRDCGWSSLDAFASFDLRLCCWRMSQLSLFEGLDEFSATWPRWGLMRSGAVFLRRPLLPRIRGIAFSSWPTPNASDGTRLLAGFTPERWAVERRKHADRGHRKQLSLSVAVRAFPSGPLPVSQEAMIADILARAAAGYSWPNLGSLSPLWVEWLMGFPMGWTESEPSATP
jgi:hypothetical protein